jgi:DinB superfamily
MTLIEVLKEEAESMYEVTEALFRRVEPGMLGWKPPTGENWMTVGQLLMHCTNSCGVGMKGFITGDWGLPEGVRFEEMKPEDMLPPASKMPSVDNVELALKLLGEDRKLASQLLSSLDGSRLLADRVPAPWGGRPITLFQHLYNMVGHLGQHKAQLFHYLKLMGQKVNTGDLYGM